MTKPYYEVSKEMFALYNYISDRYNQLLDEYVKIYEDEAIEPREIVSQLEKYLSLMNSLELSWEH